MTILVILALWPLVSMAVGMLIGRVIHLRDVRG